LAESLTADELERWIAALKECLGFDDPKMERLQACMKNLSAGDRWIE